MKEEEKREKQRGKERGGGESPIPELGDAVGVLCLFFLSQGASTTKIACRECRAWVWCWLEVGRH